GGGFEDILNSMFAGAAARGGRPGAGGAFEFDTGGIALDLDVSVAMTVSLEESVKGVEKRVRLPTGKELNVKIPPGVTAGQQIRRPGSAHPTHPARRQRHRSRDLDAEMARRTSLQSPQRPDLIASRQPKRIRPRPGDQRGTKPQSRPLASIGESSASHFA